MIAVDLATAQATVVAPIADNPRGLAVDPDGTWLYVTRLSTPWTGTDWADGGSIDRIEIASIPTTPAVETWLENDPALQGPTGMVWTELVLP